MSPRKKRAPTKTSDPAERVLVPREPTPEVVLAEQLVEGGDIVPEGDFAGMRYEDVMMLCKQQAEDALANMSIEGASAVVDMLMDDVLQVTMHYKGKVSAKESGIRFCQTALRYAMLDVSEEPDRLRSLGEAIEEFRKNKGIK